MAILVIHLATAGASAVIASTPFVSACAGFSRLHELRLSLGHGHQLQPEPPQCLRSPALALAICQQSQNRAIDTQRPRGFRDSAVSLDGITGCPLDYIHAGYYYRILAAVAMG